MSTMRGATPAEADVIRNIVWDGKTAICEAVARHNGPHPTDAAATALVRLCRETIAGLAWEVGVRGHDMSPDDAIEHFMRLLDDRADLAALVRRRMS